MHIGELDVLDRFLLVIFLDRRCCISSFGRRSSAIIEQLRAILLTAVIRHRLDIFHTSGHRVYLLIMCTIRRSKVSYINQVLTVVQILVNG